jgi:hypothetical protein
VISAEVTAGIRDVCRLRGRFTAHVMGNAASLPCADVHNFDRGHGRLKTSKLDQVVMPQLDACAACVTALNASIGVATKTRTTFVTVASRRNHPNGKSAA